MNSNINNFVTLAASSGKTIDISSRRPGIDARSILSRVIGTTSIGAVPPFSQCNSFSNPSKGTKVETDPKKGLVRMRSMHASFTVNKPSEIEGIGTPRASSNPHSSDLFSEALYTIAMDRFSADRRFSVTNKADAHISAPARHHAFPDCDTSPLPSTASFPKLPGPKPIKPIINNMKFPEMLLRVLSFESLSNIIAWLPHGRGFVILHREHFSSMILPRYFSGAKFVSFMRRLKRWGFVRASRGPESGAYHNVNFVKDQPELIQRMRYEPRESRQGREGKKKDEENETSKERKQAEKVVEGNAHCQLNDFLSRLTNQNECNAQQLHRAISANAPSLTMDICYSTIHPCRPTQLPSDFPKRPKSAMLPKKMEYNVGSHGKNANANEAAAIRVNTNNLNDHTNDNEVESSSFTTEHPNSTPPVHYYTFERRMAELRFQREMLLAQLTLPHEVTRNASRSGPANAGGVRFVANTSMPSGPHYMAASASQTQRMIGSGRTRRIREAQSSIGHRIHTSTDNSYPNSMSSDILDSSKINAHGNIASTYLDELRSRVKPTIHASTLPREVTRNASRSGPANAGGVRFVTNTSMPSGPHYMAASASQNTKNDRQWAHEAHPRGSE